MHRSSYKSWRKRPKGLSAEKIKLHGDVRAAYEESNGSAGARSIADILSARGSALSRYRAGSIMRLLGLQSSQPSSPKYKKSNNEHLAVPNKLEREFSVSEPNKSMVRRRDLYLDWNEVGLFGGSVGFIF